MSSSGKPKVLILGFGRLAEAFCRICSDRFEIRGVRRSAPGVNPCPIIAAPIQSDETAEALGWPEVVIFSPSSGGADLEGYRDTYLGNIRFAINRLAGRPAPIRLFILIGSTGVYPKATGDLWDEMMTIPMESDRQEVLLKTEAALIGSGLPYGILRCGGLYGGTRGRYDRFKKLGHLPSHEMSDREMPFVHEDDVCRVIERLIDSGRKNEVYNVVDDSRMTKTEWYRRIADRTGLPIAETGPPRNEATRRIGNAKLRRELGFIFRHNRRTDKPSPA